MALLRKLFLGLVVLLGTGIIALVVVLGHNSACPEPIGGAGVGPGQMQGIIYRCYGSPEVLELVTLERPEPAAGEVLVRVAAAGVNPLDWHYMRGAPYVMRLMSGIGRPDEERLGVDFSGTVVAVGEGVTRFSPGDAVFGGWTGAFAEYLVMRADRGISHKPDNISFEEAASVPIAAITALQAVRDKGRVREGQSVLINGASGGVGTYAVQIANTLGAEVTGVSSARNHDMVRALGATHMIDYREIDYTAQDERYDVIIDNVGNHSLLRNNRVLKPGGVLVSVGAAEGDWLAPFVAPLTGMVLSPFLDQRFETLLAILDADDMDYLASLMADGKVTPQLDRRYPLAKTADAIAYSESGRARGKIVIVMPDSTPDR